MNPIESKYSETSDEFLGQIVPNWKARDHPLSNPTHHQISGAYCRLEVLNTKTDPKVIEDLFHAFKPTEHTHFTYLRYGPFDNVQQFYEFIKQKEDPINDTILYTIFVDNKALGFLSYLRIIQDQGTIEIGNINFSQTLAKTRAATESIYLLLSLAFDELGYRRVEWKCNSLNTKSRRAAVRFGFQYEGTWKKVEVAKGRSRDSSWYSLIDEEWSEVKEKYRVWLRPENFDANGHQLTKLDAARANQQPRQLQDI